MNLSQLRDTGIRVDRLTRLLPTLVSLFCLKNKKKKIAIDISFMINFFFLNN